MYRAMIIAKFALCMLWNIFQVFMKSRAHFSAGGINFLPDSVVEGLFEAYYVKF